MIKFQRQKGPNVYNQKLLSHMLGSERYDLSTCLQKMVSKYIRDIQRRTINVSRVKIFREVIIINPDSDDRKDSKVFSENETFVLLLV